MGICCQKVSEAAVFVDAGIDDVLVTNEVIGEAKLAHLADLARKARIGVLVDDARALHALAAVAKARGAAIDAYVEVDVGAGRCGVAPGEEAVALARETEPEVAVLDVKMPRLDGIEAARRILEERPIPIVMLTAYGQDELVSRAVEAGVFGYLVKPFREQDLLPAIHAARARHEELTALREEAESLSEALEARKVIERAKGLLMTKENLSEQEAFARLRKASQVSGRPLRVVAEAVLATFGSPS